MSGCRIGKIKMKNGGAEVRRLPIAEKDQHQSSLIRSATTIASNYKLDEMKGYIVLGWDAKMSYSVGYFIHADSPFGVGTAPSAVADILRREFVDNGDWGG